MALCVSTMTSSNAYRLLCLHHVRGGGSAPQTCGFFHSSWRRSSEKLPTFSEIAETFPKSYQKSALKSAAELDKAFQIRSNGEVSLQNSAGKNEAVSVKAADLLGFVATRRKSSFSESVLERLKPELSKLKHVYNPAAKQLIQGGLNKPLDSAEEPAVPVKQAKVKETKKEAVKNESKKAAIDSTDISDSTSKSSAASKMKIAKPSKARASLSRNVPETKEQKDKTVKENVLETTMNKNVVEVKNDNKKVVNIKTTKKQLKPKADSNSDKVERLVEHTLRTEAKDTKEAENKRENKPLDENKDTNEVDANDVDTKQTSLKTKTTEKVEPNINHKPLDISADKNHNTKGHEKNKVLKSDFSKMSKSSASENRQFKNIQSKAIEGDAPNVDKETSKVAREEETVPPQFPAKEESRGMFSFFKKLFKK